MAYPSTFKVAEAVDEAFERIQFNPQSLVAEHMVSARRSIRLMLDTWNSDSVNFWRVVSGVEHTVTTNDTTFTPAAGCLDVLSVGLKRSDVLTPMLMMSRTDWFALPDRVEAIGMPTRYWTERNSVPPTVHYYPMAENSSDIIVYDAWMEYADASQLSGGLGVPPRWNEAFVSGLTAYLAKKFKPEVADAKMREYGGPMFTSPANTIKSAYEIARAGDRERGDTVFRLHKRGRLR